MIIVTSCQTPENYSTYCRLYYKGTKRYIRNISLAVLMLLYKEFGVEITIDIKRFNYEGSNQYRPDHNNLVQCTFYFKDEALNYLEIFFGLKASKYRKYFKYKKKPMNLTLDYIKSIEPAMIADSIKK